MQQATNTILMIRPINLRMNEETAVNNYYQKVIDNISPTAINIKAQHEFDAFVNVLEQIGINVIVLSDTNTYDTPDAHFPNNWISFHQQGIVALYPMFAKNRRLERREDVLTELEKKGFQINDIVDYTGAEKQNLFLEGTGSLILDRINRKAYCALSPRTNEDLCIEFCEDFEYTPVIFTSNQTVNMNREPIYHTNVMMCIAETFAVICLDSIDDKQEQKNVINHLKQDGKDIINITEKQLHHFAGNMLQVKNNLEEYHLVMSQAAFNSLNQEQIKRLKEHNKLVYSSLDIIEASGGGSARCMMAEVFLPKKIK